MKTLLCIIFSFASLSTLAGTVKCSLHEISNDGSEYATELALEEMVSGKVHRVKGKAYTLALTAGDEQGYIVIESNDETTELVKRSSSDFYMDSRKAVQHLNASVQFDDLYVSGTCHMTH